MGKPAVNSGRKIVVQNRDVIKRINRMLEDKGLMLHKNKRSRSAKDPDRLTLREVEQGLYYVTSDKGVVERDVDLEAYARKLGALADHETVVQEAPGYANLDVMIRSRSRRGRKSSGRRQAAHARG